MTGGRRTRAWISRGLLTRDGQELTETGERAAEYLAECRADWWDPPAQFDDAGPDGHGWAPDPFPGGSLI